MLLKSRSLTTLQKYGKTQKSNYRPISVLSNVSKIYERSLYDQIYSYFDKIFSIYQCGFCKGISPQHILLTMIEKMKISRDNKQCCAATLTDFSKVLDFIPYDLLIAKLNANGFDQEALKLIHSYLIDHKKWVLHLARNYIFCSVFFKGQYLVHYYLI